jgi:hypothetical protein
MNAHKHSTPMEIAPDTEAKDDLNLQNPLSVTNLSVKIFPHSDFQHYYY